jgi:hypothetical protein
MHPRARHLGLAGLALSFGALLSCGAAPHYRKTYADNGRIDDPWLEGARCTEETRAMRGLQVETVEEGTGAPVSDGETVRVRYVARLTTGEVVHDTGETTIPIEIVVGSTPTICGFERALLGMRAGERRRATVPWQLAFSDAGRPPELPPRADLVFQIDLYRPAVVGTEHGAPPSRPAPAGGGGGRRR